MLEYFEIPKPPEAPHEPHSPQNRLGLPLSVASTVPSITHVISLTTYEVVLLGWRCWEGFGPFFGSDLGASGRVPHVDAFGGPGFLWLGRKLSPKIANVHRAEASKPLTQWPFVQSEAYRACPLQSPGASAKFLGTLLGSLVSGDPTIWGCIFGSPFFGHPPFDHSCPGEAAAPGRAQGAGQGESVVQGFLRAL